MKNTLEKKIDFSLPVSRKFYVRIRARVAGIVGRLQDMLPPECAASVMDAIDTYLSGAEIDRCLSGRDRHESRLIFLSLKDEIDVAVERSRRARERARRRVAARAASLGVTPVAPAACDAVVSCGVSEARETSVIPDTSTSVVPDATVSAPAAPPVPPSTPHVISRPVKASGPTVAPRGHASSSTVARPTRIADSKNVNGRKGKYGLTFVCVNRRGINRRACLPRRGSLR